MNNEIQFGPACWKVKHRHSSTEWLERHTDRVLFRWAPQPRPLYTAVDQTKQT